MPLTSLGSVQAWPRRARGSGCNSGRRPEHLLLTSSPPWGSPAVRWIRPDHLVCTLFLPRAGPKAPARERLRRELVL